MRSAGVGRKAVSTDSLFYPRLLYLEPLEDYALSLSFPVRHHEEGLQN